MEFIQILDSENIIIGESIYRYEIIDQRVYIWGAVNEETARAIDYLLFNRKKSKPLLIPRGYKRVDKWNRIAGVVYQSDVGIFISVLATAEHELKIHNFMHEKLATYFILREAPILEIDRKRMIEYALGGSRSSVKKNAPGVFNMVRYNGFTFNHRYGQVEAFNRYFERKMFDNLADATEWI